MVTAVRRGAIYGFLKVFYVDLYGLGYYTLLKVVLVARRLG